MNSLQDSHPQTYEAFCNGDFVVQRSSQNPFGQIPVDQTIEQTINRDTKTKGGIIGFSTNRSAVQRWVYTANERAAITESCRKMAGLSTEKVFVSKEAGKARSAKDHSDVLKVVDALETMVNPFQPCEKLTSLSNGIKASIDVESDMLEAYAIGQSCLDHFLDDRVSTQKTGFNAVLPQNKLKTFASMKPKSRSAREGKEYLSNVDRDIFARLLVIANAKQMDLKEVFKFELGSYPWSLAATDGSLMHPEKSQLLGLLESTVPPLASPPSNACWIFDGMAILQSMKVYGATFSELANQILGDMMKQVRDPCRVDCVFDTYPAISIKSCEHESRASSHGSIKVKIVSPQQKLPLQWKAFLSESSNKTALVEFLVDEWKNSKFATTFHRFPLFTTCNDKFFKFQSNDGITVERENVPGLMCDHEEADTRMLLHAKNASDEGNTTVIIRTPDTDVLVLGIYYQYQIDASLLVLMGNGRRRRVIDTHAIAESLGQAMVAALPGYHAFTGKQSILVSCQFLL